MPPQTEEQSGRCSASLSSFIAPNKSVCNPATDLYSSRGVGYNGKFSEGGWLPSGGGGGATSTGSTGKLISCNTALRLNLSFVCKHLEEDVGEQLRAA